MKVQKEKTAESNQSLVNQPGAWPSLLLFIHRIPFFMNQINQWPHNWSRVNQSDVMTAVSHTQSENSWRFRTLGLFLSFQREHSGTTSSQLWSERRPKWLNLFDLSLYSIQERNNRIMNNSKAIIRSKSRLDSVSSRRKFEERKSGRYANAVRGQSKSIWFTCVNFY